MACLMSVNSLCRSAVRCSVVLPWNSALLQKLMIAQLEINSTYLMDDGYLSCLQQPAI
jgi:hypothetical protein